MLKGKIIKGIGGFYYIKPFDSFLYPEVIECKARGVFRHTAIKPIVGDLVRLNEKRSGEFLIEEILPRKNALIRPPVSNVDNGLLCLSVDDPKPDLMLLDKLIVNCLAYNIRPIICITKTDLDLEMTESIAQIYNKAGFLVLRLTNKNPDDFNLLEDILKDNTSFLAGASGVGKSTLANRLGSIQMEIGNTSKKLRRGKNTTRHVQLIDLDETSFILDTPGFSSFELEEKIEPEEIKSYYPEFSEYSCKYSDCLHLKEPDCGVREALEAGEIDIGRYERYKNLVQIQKEKKPY